MITGLMYKVADIDNKEQLKESQLNAQRSQRQRVVMSTLQRTPEFLTFGKEHSVLRTSVKACPHTVFVLNVCYPIPF